MTGPAGTTAPSGAFRTVRLGLLGLALLSVLAIGYELFAERHWRSAIQLVPWVVLVVLLAAILLAFSARRAAVVAARALAVLALVASGFGVYQHIAQNYRSGELDASYSDSWETLSASGKLVLAVTKSVGATPPIAPGALGQTALLVLLATVGLGRRAPG